MIKSVVDNFYSEILLFLRQWIESCPMDFDLTSSPTHLSILSPLTAKSAELAKVIEALGRGTATEEQDSARLNNDSPKGKDVCSLSIITVDVLI